ncbi:SulP family inorganic anion transporter [Nocardioides sp. W7]|uniref:SulP family inorganic anion transporter n=1 Tax=Nocardioides sp. W7 TaxID=2931390 RepID=UPI001FD13264|nr:SulP family inorganic anion transporter [Nocardioides sp. W7]
MPERRYVGKDALAGLPGAISSVPDGMASAVLVGVNPVYGLYASFAGPVAGGLTSSTRLMVITATTAAALAAGSAVSGLDREERPEALFLLTVMTGLVMVAAGLLRLGRYTRFVSHSVMTGFLTGVAVNIICGQLGDLSGYAAEGANSLAKAFDVITHPGNINVASLLTGIGALVILFGLARTRLNTVSALVALVIPTLVVILTSADVIRVEDQGAIPRSLPVPSFPDLGLISVDLVANAFAIAVIVLVQGAGVSESAPNADGRPSNMNQDFLAQGVANLASGLVRGLPVGGSVGQTALNVSAGARTRWASILGGLWMGVILVVFAGVVGLVAMPTLAAVLIFAAVGALRPDQVATIWRTGRMSQIAMAATFAATLILPVATAVAVGVVISLLLQLNRETMDLTVVELVPTDDHQFTEQPDPPTLSSHQVTVLDVYGSLFYAGARTLQARLPEVGESRAPAVVLRLRGRTSLGATFFRVVAAYAEQLSAAGGRLYVSGLDPHMAELLARTVPVSLSPPDRAFGATPVLGESTWAALHDAQAWVVRPTT